MSPTQRQTIVYAADLQSECICEKCVEADLIIKFPDEIQRKEFKKVLAEVGCV